MFEKIKNRKNTEMWEQKRKRRRRRAAVGAGLLLAVLCLFAARAVLFAKEEAPAAPTAAAARADITAEVDAGGKVISLQEKTYYSPVNADIKKYDLKVGQTVKKGDTLVTFDTDMLEKDNRKAELTAASSIGTNEDAAEKADKTLREAASARERMTAVQADIDAYKQYISDLNTSITDRTRELSEGDGGDVNDAGLAEELSAALAAAARREALDALNETYRSEIDTLTVEMSRAEFDQDSSTAGILRRQIAEREDRIAENEDSIESLNERMGAYADQSASELEAMLSAVNVESTSGGAPADPSLDESIAQWQRELSDAQSRLAELQSELAEEKARADSGEEAKMTAGAKKAAESSSNLAELESASAEELLAKGKKGIHAEFPGIVTKAELGRGTPATQGMELVTIASNEKMAVRATVSKYDYSDLKKGQKAVIEIGGYSYDGTVGDISRMAEVNEKDAPVITCEVLFGHPDDHVVLGMEARVNIVTSRKSNVLTVPLEAVNTGRGGTFCYVLEDGKVARREVNAGIQSADKAEILSGLREGELVITRLPEGLEEGMEVRPEEADSDGASGGGAS